MLNCLFGPYMIIASVILTLKEEKTNFAQR